MEEIEELDDENCEIETDIKFDLNWTCKYCGNNDNTEYNIPIEKTIICECKKCGKKFEYYYCPY